MTKQVINVGTTANDKKGDSLRAAFQKVNSNFTELYTAMNADVQIPDQSGNNGKYLTTDGAGNLSWGTVSSGTTLPNQSGNNGKYLTTDGAGNLSWGTVTTGITASSSDTLTNKTMNIAVGQGNTFQIQGNSITSYSGSGSVVALTTLPTLYGLNVNDSGLTIDGGSGNYFWKPTAFDGTGTIHKSGIYKSNPDADNALFTFGANSTGTMSVAVEGSLFVGNGVPSNSGGLNTNYGGWLVVQAGAKFGGDINTLGGLHFDDATNGYIYFTNNATITPSSNDLTLTTNTGGSKKTWTFGNNGNLTFPDSTVQTTAWTGTSLATVATSGSYNDLSDKPTLFSGSYNDLSSKPSLATVATSGSYTDLTSKPTSTNTGISGWLYSGLSKSIVAAEGTSMGLYIKPDGTKIWIVGQSADAVIEYTFGTPNDVSTLIQGNSFSIIGQDTASTDITFKPDGTKMYVLGDTANAVFEYDLSIAWDISTAVYNNKTFVFTTQDATPNGIDFKPDGTALYMIGATTDAVFQYSLSTPWDTTTCSYVGASTSAIVAQETNGSAIQFNSTGTSFYLLGTTGDDINQFNLGTPWDITTTVYSEKFYVGWQGGSPTGFRIDFTNNRLYVVDNLNDAIYQYTTTNNNSVILSGSNILATGFTRINNNFYVDGMTVFDGTSTFTNAITALGALSVTGTITASGTLSAASTISLTGSTTGTVSLGTSTTTANISVGTALTTGTVTIGGTASTGAMTFGQSTGAQTLNIGTGATLASTTKAINIGTAGVSASVTNINIGSAVAGATGTTYLNNLTSFSTAAAVSAAGSTQATSTALTANINIITTVAASTGVALPTGIAGMVIRIYNAGANALSIYPVNGGSAKINALATNAAYSLATSTSLTLVCASATQWYTF